MIAVDALLAEIRAQGPAAEPEGKRLTPTDVADYAQRLDANNYRLAARALRQQRADLATLAAEVERARKSETELVRSAQSLLGRYNFYDMPEDDSRQWQVLADACLRSGVS